MLFPKLKILVLDNLELTGLQHLNFNTQLNISCLILRNNKIQDFTTFPQLPELKHLDISNNSFKIGVENSISNLYPNLHVLIMGNTENLDKVPDEYNRISFSTSYLNSMEIFKVFFMTQYFTFEDVILKHEIIDDTILCMFDSMNLTATLKLDSINFIGTMENQLLSNKSQSKTNTSKTIKQVGNSQVLREAKSQLQRSNYGPLDTIQQNQKNNMSTLSLRNLVDEENVRNSQSYNKSTFKAQKKQLITEISIYNVVTGFEISLERRITVSLQDLMRGYKLKLNFDSHQPQYGFDKIIEEQNKQQNKPDFTNLSSGELLMNKQVDFKHIYGKQMQSGQNVKIIFLRIGNTVLMICAERSRLRSYGVFSNKIQEEIQAKSAYIDDNKAVVDQIVDELHRQRTEQTFYENSKAPEQYYLRHSPDDTDDFNQLLESTFEKEQRGVPLSPREQYVQRLITPASVGIANRRSPGASGLQASWSMSSPYGSYQRDIYM